MSHHHVQRVPLPAIIGAGVLMVLTVALAATARSQGLGAHEESMAVSASAELRFRDNADGSIAVVDARTGGEVTSVPPGSNGFVRGVMRGMFRTRKLESLSRDAVFRLWRRQDGRLFLEDAESGRRIDLGSFGPTNEQAFAAMLDRSEASLRSLDRSDASLPSPDASQAQP